LIDLTKIAGFGIAGNFAHHLEQAGESADFVDVKVDDENAPKGIFPFYLPTFDGFIGTYPISSDSIVNVEGESLQMEPEVALLCDVIYKDEKVTQIKPKAFTAYNDCSIRRPGAKKISEKKNWGQNSKGVSLDFKEIDTFSSGGVMDYYRIASFIKRDGKLIAYGEDTQMLGYSYFYETLIEWMVTKFQSQTDQGPLEAIGTYLKSVDLPETFLISIGATRYTEFGEHHFLENGDELFVLLYDTRYENEEAIEKKLTKGETLHHSSSLLHQKVIEGSK